VRPPPSGAPSGPPSGAPSGASELRLLGGAVSQASRERLAQVVSLLDTLPDRADADRLLDRARPRLRELNLPRPLNLTRLLFLPLDELIVPPQAWQPGAPTIPRTALRALAAAARAALEPAATRIEAGCAGLTVAEHGREVRALGEALWPAAARALPEATPADWAGTGLPDRAYPSLRERCAAGWRHAVTSWPALRAAGDELSDEVARRALEGPAAEGGVALEVVLRGLMRRTPRPASLAALALRLAPAGSARETRAVQEALDEALRRPGAGPAAAGDRAGQARQAALDATAALSLIEDFEASGFLDLPARRGRVQAIRKAADEACRASFGHLLAEEMVAPLAALRRDGATASDGTVLALEETARALRRVEGAGRRLGWAEGYDAALRAAAAEVVRNAAATGLGRIEQLRLVEMLAGSRAALDMVPRGAG